jgi:hypothetical protein
MNENSITFGPTADSLKKELGESLRILKADFESLTRFVAEVSPDGDSAVPMTLTKNDRDTLLSVTQEIHDAANDIEFEADKIKDKLSRL